MSDLSPNPPARHDAAELSAFAHQLADEAAVQLRTWFGRATTSIKADGSFVTEADLAVDRAVRAALAARYPHHALLSEETTRSYQGSDWTWVIDPLDGTTNFANGLPIWGSSIALLFQGEPVLGLLDFPLLGQRFSAQRGLGAHFNGQALHCPPQAALHNNQFLIMDTRSVRRLHISAPPKVRVLGSAAFDLAAVSRGVAVGCFELLPKIWDIAAVWLILQEADAHPGLLFPGPDLFPLLVGADYSERIFPLLAAASADHWHELRAAIHFTEHSGPLLALLAAQGWQTTAAAAAPSLAG
ncbi:MAG: inositol monophosphatase family protein [Caldilineales bacterium]